MTHLISDSVIPSKNLKGEVIVRVWEVFLNHSKQNLYHTISTYALVKPLHDVGFEGTISFTFTRFDWNRTLKALLQSNNIPFIEAEVPADIALMQRSLF